MIQKKFIFLFFLLVHNLLLHSQIMQVNDAMKLIPIPDVKISSFLNSETYFTNSSGEFAVSIFTMKDTLLFEKEGYLPQKISVKEIIDKNYMLTLEKDLLNFSKNVFAPLKRSDDYTELSISTLVLFANDINNSFTHNSSDLLLETGGISLQKQQGAGSSPVIRGFTANHLVFLIDGIKQNNASFSLENQNYAIFVDKCALEKVEVLNGASSVVYGSDAMGGVVSYVTKNPQLAGDIDVMINFNEKPKKVRQNGSAFTIYNTGNDGFTGHFDMNLGLENIASFTSFTLNDCGDMVAGTKNSSTLPNNWGATPYFVQTLNNTDTMINNPTPNRLIYTSYSQSHFIQKLLFVPQKNMEFLLNFQYSEISEYNRNDKLSEFYGDTLKYALWRYEPRNKLLTSFTAKYNLDNKFFNSLLVSFAYQRISEVSRIRAYQQEKTLQQAEKVEQILLNVDFTKILNGNNRMHYGCELANNNLTSNAFFTSFDQYYNQIIEQAQNLYPIKSSYTQELSAYLAFKLFFNSKNIINTGLRFTYSSLNADFSHSILTLPYTHVTNNNTIPALNIGFIHKGSHHFNYYAQVATAYHTPNIDDIGSITEHGNYLLIPNILLQPEHTINKEIGINKTFFNHYNININFYHNSLFETILKTSTYLNNSDSIFFNGFNYQLITKTNIPNAVIAGASFLFTGNNTIKNATIKYSTSINYVYGINKTQNAPLPNIPPLNGALKFEIDNKNIHAFTHFIFNGSKSYPQIENSYETTKSFYPFWLITNSGFKYNFNSNIVASFAVENIFNMQYLIFNSAIGGIGRSYIASFEVIF